MRGYQILLIIVLSCFISSCTTQPSITSLPECRVGLVLPTTGEMAPYGAEGVLAARIALTHAKEKFKNCSPILYEQDSASDPNQSNLAAANLLAPPKSAQVIVGEINSANTAAMVNQARAADVPIIAPTASMISLTSMSQQVFRIWPSDAYEAKKMKEYMANEGVKKVAVLYLQVPYGEEMAKQFEQEFKSDGEVLLESYPKGIMDFKPLLQRLQNYDNIYLISYVEDAVLILKQAYELKLSTDHKFRFFGTSVLDNPKLVEKAGIASDGITFAVVQPESNGDTEMRTRFITDYKNSRSTLSENALQAAAVEPTFAGFHVYDAVFLAFSACSATASGNSPSSGQLIMKQLRTMPLTIGTTGNIQFDPKGDLLADRTVVFKQVNKGIISPL